MGSSGQTWTYYTSKCWKSRAGRSRSIKKMGVARKFKVGPNWEVLYYYCSECTCYLNEVCDNEFHPLVGNGFCNDETNNFKCNFDGGDCCGLCILKDHSALKMLLSINFLMLLLVMAIAMIEQII